MCLRRQRRELASHSSELSSWKPLNHLCYFSSLLRPPPVFLPAFHVSLCFLFRLCHLCFLFSELWIIRSVSLSPSYLVSEILHAPLSCSTKGVSGVTHWRRFRVMGRKCHYWRLSRSSLVILVTALRSAEKKVKSRASVSNLPWSLY